MFYAVIKLDGHFKTRYFNGISLVFSNARRVLSQHKTWLSLLYLLYDVDLHPKKLRKASSENNKTCLSDETANQSAR
jgi:hypothetical protein